MATGTASEEVVQAPSAAKGAAGEATRKQSDAQGRGGGGGGRGGGGGGGGFGGKWKKRKNKEVFIYGNYRNYYGYRVARENFNDICIYPEKFREILLDKIGFRSVEVITDRLVGSVTGFDRPIEVYHK